MNLILGNSKQVFPEVGMGATALWAKDRHAGTIVEILKKKNGELKGFIWQQDIAKRTDANGTSDSQQYEYTTDKNGNRYEVILRKNGKYLLKGHDLHGTSFLIGERCEFYDFSF